MRTLFDNPTVFKNYNLIENNTRETKLAECETQDCKNKNDVLCRGGKVGQSYINKMGWADSEHILSKFHRNFVLY